MGSSEGLRIVATLVGGGFLVCAAAAVVTGTLYDVDDGHVERAARPLTFWLLVAGMTILGLTILAVGWQWPIAGTVGRFLSSR